MRRTSKRQRSINGGTDDDDFEKLKEVRNTADKVRLFIGLVGLLLGSTFTFAKLRGLPVVKVSSDDWSRFFVEVALVIFFWAWMVGSRSDLNAQERVMRALLVPKRRIYNLLLWCVALVIVFSVLWRIDNFAMFSVALIGFFVLDLILYYYFYNRVLRVQFRSLRKEFSERNNAFSLLEVDIVDEYMKGKWRYWRYGFGLAWVAAFLIADITGAAGTIAGLAGVFSADSLLALSVLVLVIVMEVWIWGFRVKRQGQCLFVAQLRHRFNLHAKHGA